MPGHIAHRKTEGYLFENSWLVTNWQNFQGRIAHSMEYFAEHGYHRALKKVLKYRYAAWAAATGVVIINVALMSSGRVVFQFMPAVEGDVVYGSLQMPVGVPGNITEDAIEILETAALELKAELEEELIALKASGAAPELTEEVVDSILTIVGGRAPREGPQRPGAGGGGNAGSSEVAEVVLYLTPFFDRGEISSALIRDRWREKVGSIPDALELSFTSDSFTAGDAINFRLEGRDEENLKIAATQLRTDLARYPGVFDISDSFRAGKQEVQIEILES